MELGPEDVSLLERCPHFRGCYMYIFQLVFEELKHLYAQQRQGIVLIEVPLCISRKID